MGFKDAKNKVIACLESGHVRHEVRNRIDVKNLLATGVLSLAEVASIIGKSRGSDYSCSPHHHDRDIDVHVIKSKQDGKSWYIKWYFVNPECVFISVH